MSGWTRHDGTAVLLPQDGIDTDQLIPARFMSTPRSAGYGQFLMYDARFDGEGRALHHPLNDARPTILVANRNFGSGSSREAAVYALVDYGIRAVLAPSFGDIFAANAVNNGLLPGLIDADTYSALAAHLSKPAPLIVDLDTMTVAFGVRSAGIGLDPVPRRKIMNGWDDIDLTAQYSTEIGAFANVRRDRSPWAWPATQ